MPAPDDRPSAVAPDDVDALFARLEAIEAQGAARFDAPGCRCVRALLDRAEEIEVGGARVLARAEARLGALERRLSRARERARGDLDDLAARGIEPGPRARAALARGDLAHARRAIRRLRALPPLPAAAPKGGPDSPAERYRLALTELTASRALARARDSVPREVGPYNTQLIATRTLDRVAALSPTYLRHLVERLEDLASLQSLAAPLAPKKKRRSPRAR